MTWRGAAWTPSGRNPLKFPPVLCTDPTPAAHTALRDAGVCLAIVLSAFDRRGAVADGAPTTVLASANLLAITLRTKQRALRGVCGIVETSGNSLTLQANNGILSL